MLKCICSIKVHIKSIRKEKALKNGFFIVGIIFDDEVPDVKYPGDDGSIPPGDDYEWHGKLPIGGDKGAWVNPITGEQWHPDLNHAPPKGPHWDYEDRNGNWWSVFKDGRIIPIKK